MKHSQFFPAIDEGICYEFDSEDGCISNFEYLGYVCHDEKNYAFFFPITEETPVGSSGDVSILEVTEFDEDEMPACFNNVEDELLSLEIYEVFKLLTEDYFEFE